MFDTFYYTKNIPFGPSAPGKPSIPDGPTGPMGPKKFKITT